MRLRRAVPLLIALVTLVFPISALLCGTERWPVKVCQDQHVKYLFKNNRLSSKKTLTPTPTTIAKLHSFAWPFGADRKKPPKWANDQRSTSKVEYQIWVLTTFLTEKRTETDEDYHLVLKSGNRTMVAEMPNKNCLNNTPEPLRSQIIKARSDFDDWANGPNKHFPQKVRITGVGFFDTLGHATGTSPNGIELHPVTKIEVIN